VGFDELPDCLMRITIIYDNESLREDLQSDWGFSCLVEVNGRRILFDTGENGSILLHNMRVLNISPDSIDEIFLSHVHFDHIGGLSAFLEENSNVKVYAPSSLKGIKRAEEIIYVTEFTRMGENTYSTGMLKDVEQSLLVNTGKGLAVVTGCSHPGVDCILSTATRIGKPTHMIGGLHGFKDLELIEDLMFICPVHCTKHISEIKKLYPDKYLRGGAGKTIEI
jgi:7,8-dihydropterin-6-yl-methyl-4-(beta-D-ribofuranosyl)aminobenzene 5'-phosphate synthase